MFTGIVEEIGSIRAIELSARVATLEVDAGVTVEGADVGGSIAVNGVCLTIVERRPDGFVFEMGPETLARTALRHLAPGDPVNLERPLRFGGAPDPAAGRRAGAAPDSPGVGCHRRRQPHRGGAGGADLRGDADPAHAGGDDAWTAGAGPGDEHRGGRDRQVSGALAGAEGDDMTAFSAIEGGIEEVRQGRILLVVGG